MNLLGHFEQTLLVTLGAAEEERTGIDIADSLEGRTGRRPSPGAVYTALDRLETRGLVRSRLGDPMPQRGGKARRHYRLTPAGATAARKVLAAMASLVDSVPLKQKP